MEQPDHIYDPDDWEYTALWTDRNDLADNCDVRFVGIKRFETLIKGPEYFCVWVGNDYQWFKTRGEAEAAWKADAAQTPQESST